MRVFALLLIPAALILFSCGTKQSNGTGHYANALAAIDSSNYSVALQQLNEAIETKENDTTLAYLFFLRGQMHEKTGSLDLAVVDYAEAAKQNPSDVTAHLKAGNVFNLLGKYDDALNSYNSALTINADNIDALLKRADILTATDKDSLAFADFEKVISLEPENDYAIMSRALIYQRFNQQDKCCADLEKAASLGNETAAEFLHSMCGKQK
ncbi:MAG: tetratricopeptide repeat protein [Bacteroidia bacterium]